MRTKRQRSATTTVTFGDCAQSHYTMQLLGHKADAGLSYEDLNNAKHKFELHGVKCEMFNLAEQSKIADLHMSKPAYVLVIRSGINHLLQRLDQRSSDVKVELAKLKPDKKLITPFGYVKNKRARHNVCITADTSQEPKYSEGKGRIVNYKDVPLTSYIQSQLPHYFEIPNIDLKAVVDYYFNTKTCGIRYHTSEEKRIAIAMDMGASFPLHFHFYLKGNICGERILIPLNNGDLYAFSEGSMGAHKPEEHYVKHARGIHKKYTQTKP